jgi:flagellar basal-body rod protein FlgC
MISCSTVALERFVMNSIVTNALSGLNAARKRLEVSAANVANVDSDGALPDSDGAPNAPLPYTPLRVEQLPLPSGGTFAIVVPVDPRLVRRYAPNSPAANAAGIVASPNVDLAGEAVSQLAATQAYKANLRVLKVAQDLQEESVAMLGHTRHDLSA